MALIALLVIKLWQLYNFDIIKAIYNYDHAKFQFNISHFVIFNLMWCCLVYGHYYFFNFIFTGQTEPCVGGDYMYASSEAFFNQTSSVNLFYNLVYHCICCHLLPPIRSCDPPCDHDRMYPPSKIQQIGQPNRHGRSSPDCSVGRAEDWSSSRIFLPQCPSGW